MKTKWKMLAGFFGCGSFESSNHDCNGTRAKGKNHGPGSNTANGLEQLGRLRGKCERDGYPRECIMDGAKLEIARLGIRCRRYGLVHHESHRRNQRQKFEIQCR